MDKVKGYFDNLSLEFIGLFGEPQDKLLPFQKDVHQWENLFFYGEPLFRHIHLEYYKTDRICVLHANVFPSALVDFPILGFDLIAMGGKVTGLFFDFTPVNENFPELEESLIAFKNTIKSKHRELPEWANFFSKDFICVSPNEDELDYLLNGCKLLIINYFIHIDKLIKKYQNNINIQNNYCVRQKMNDKTFKALAAEIGDDSAKDFLNNYLFPEITL
jgi:hypothetical protein